MTKRIYTHKHVRHDLGQSEKPRRQWYFGLKWKRDMCDVCKHRSAESQIVFV